MYNFNYDDGNIIGRVCLEASLKPFKELDSTSIEAVCEKLFRGWEKLTDKAETVAVMLWTADGSEILEYSGDLSQTFDYCDVIGIGNPTKTPPYEEHEKNNLHVRPVLYNGKRKEMTYAILRDIILSLKKVGKAVTGKDIRVIETFDPGPEFANSDFKYRRHPEICKGNIMGKKMWLHCASTLHADDVHYAAYPDGIPEGTHFGEFLGKQLMCLCRDTGFDGIWLSNGFGFSLDSWNWKGEVFDGERFDSEGIPKVRDSINEFWKRFTAETGDMLIETRGSNLSAGMDISAHGCPADDINTYNMLTPPNSPWAALNYRFGLELCGHMSRIAEISKNGYLFRYYTHDPWWYNSPWFDRYGRSPHDIYLPLALARVGEDGSITKPYGINFLSVDDSLGELPEKCPNEVIPHILEGFNNYSDAPGLVTWLYPFNDYCQKGLREGRAGSILMDDWLMENAMDCGFPVNTVVSERNFQELDAGIFKDTVLVCPVPFEDSILEKCIIKAVENKLPVLMYGNTEKASERIRTLIGVKNTVAISGVLGITQNIVKDTYTDAALSTKINHIPIVSDGGVSEIACDNVEAFAKVSDDHGNERAYGIFNKTNNIAWIRGSFPHDNTKPGALPALTTATENFPSAILLRSALSFFGINISYKTMSPTDKLPINLFSRHDNAYYMTGFAKDTTVTTELSFPLGVPMPNNTEAIIENNIGNFSTAKWCHNECRVFIKQEKRSKVICMTHTAGDTMKADKRIGIYGLDDADVTFLAPGNVTVFAADRPYADGHYFDPDEVLPDGRVIFRKRSGDLFILWQDKDTREEYLKNGIVL
ncbi:MAG: hypothetical protein E7583_05530 [Ruminococcaceae bacterium]|nr:hypothetical protein [Oscillospiraceae bacterium]